MHCYPISTASVPLSPRTASGLLLFDKIVGSRRFFTHSLAALVKLFLVPISHFVSPQH